MNRKKLVLTAVVLVMVLSFTSCTFGGDSADKSLVGQWQGTVDITRQLQDIPGIAEYGVVLEDVGFDLILSFTDDGRFEAIVDAYSVGQMVDKLVSVVVDALRDTAAQKGVTEAQLRQRVEETVNTEGIVQSVQESFQNGYYIYSQNVIYLSSRDYLKLDPERYAQEKLVVEREGTVLRITKITNGRNTDGLLNSILPLELKYQ